jgi:3-hydroxyisobutyrate dehydrogenase
MHLAWFGAGLMGAAFTEALHARGEDVVVWNRTHEKALALERFGARAEPDARKAANGASRIHLSLSDDAAVDGVLAQLDGALRPDAIVIDHSTVAPAATAARFERMAAQGHAFLHAPLFMSPSAVRAAQGVMLVCGPRATFERARSGLEQMASRLYYLGEDGSKAAALKLVGNAMGTLLVAGLADIFTVGRSTGVAPHEALDLLVNLELGGAIERLGDKMISGDVTPNVELHTARKDVRLMLDAVASAAQTVYVLPTIAARMDALIAEGRGSDDIVILGTERTLADSANSAPANL